MKSANCISHTGLNPSTAAPTAMPMMAFSASGVSQTRFGPNSSINPAVTLNAPPKAPMSSPRQKTESSARISSRSPSEIASRYVSSGMLPLPPRPRRLAVQELRLRLREHAGGGNLRFRHGLLERPRGLALELLLDGGANRLHVDALGAKPLLVAADRIAGLPLVEHLRRHVAHVVVSPVTVHAHRLRLDQRRTATRARPLAGLGGRGEHGLDVVTVHLHSREAVAGGALDRVHRELPWIRCRVRPLIVLEHEHQRQLPDARDIHRLVPLTIGCGAIP